LSRSSTAAVAPGAPAERTLAVVPASSEIHYHLVHRLHRVHGRSSAVQGGAILRGDGSVVAAAIVPTTSFRSGDADRDARVLEVVGRQVAFKGEAKLDGLTPGVRRVAMAGELTLHGVRRPVTVPLEVELAADGSARVRGSFELSLEAHAIERPSLLLMKVEDACRIDLQLALAPKA
jgi:hypothetical protein